MIIQQPQAIYLMDKAYVDFEALFRINQAEAFFVTRAKTSQRYEVIEQNFDIDQDKGLRADKTIMLVVLSTRFMLGVWRITSAWGNGKRMRKAIDHRTWISKLLPPDIMSLSHQYRRMSQSS